MSKTVEEVLLTLQARIRDKISLCMHANGIDTSTRRGSLIDAYQACLEMIEVEKEKLPRHRETEGS